MPRPLLAFLVASLVVTAFSEPARSAAPSVRGEAVPTLSSAAKINSLKAGDPRKRVLEVLGRPDGSIQMGKPEILLYAGVQLTIEDGVLKSLPPNLAGKLAAAQRKQEDAARKQAREDAQRKEEETAIPHPTAPASTVAVRKPTPKPKIQFFRSHKKTLTSSDAIRHISNGGKRIHLGELTGKGKITVVDFYANWSGPSKRMAPTLEQLATDNEDIELVRIDIVHWDTEVANQFHLRTIPHVKIFDPNGGLLGDRPGDLQRLLKERGL